MQEAFFRTSDYGIAGYLFARRVNHVHLERSGPQVIFCFPTTPDVTAAVGEYTSNRPVPCRNFFHGLRKAKMMIQEIVNHGNATG